jgi:hypothetical protein
MLIPTGFKRLPSTEGCYNNQIIFGSTVGDMAGALAQLSNCKFLGQAHYHIGKKAGVSNGGYSGPNNANLKRTYNYNLLYQSTPLSSHLAIMITCRAFSNPTITTLVDVELRDTASNSYTGTVLDYGIRFNHGAELTGLSNDIVNVFSGTQLVDAPTNTTPDLPRPLYVPSANRGELLNINFDFLYVQPFMIHIYDLLVPEVTP